MTKRTYDARLRNAIARSCDPDLFPELNIPRSMALQWIREGAKEVVTHPSLGKSYDILIEENTALQKAVCRVVDEHLTDHNNRIPYYALGGAMPIEVFSGT